MFNPISQCNAARAAGPARKRLLALAVGIAGSLPLAVLADPTDLSNVPLPTFSVGSAVDVKPNILMVLDDSGSMDWDYLPDWANSRPSNYSSLPDYFRKNAAFNGVAYNPAVHYKPPVTFTADGAKDTAKYPSMTGRSNTTGGDWNASAASPNWKSVPNDGYGVQSSSKSNLQNSAFFFTAVAGEYCDSPALSNCTATAVPTGNFQYPAPLRWCSNTSLSTCRGLWTSTYRYPRMPVPRLVTITFSGASSAKVTSIKVNSKEILSSATGSSSSNNDVASAVASRINACTMGNPSGGNCQVVGYTASSSGRSVRIYAPGVTSATPAVSYTGSLSFSITSGDTSTTGGFARSKAPLPDWHDGDGQSSGAVPGENLLTVITPDVNSYPYPGTNTKHPARTDCAGDTCTYQEEMTNYANWWAYYRTRMQMMKTATSLAFSSLDSDEDIAEGKTRYRVGYLTLNNNTGSDFVNIKDFDGSHKFAWFSRMLQAEPEDGTPLRRALSTAGRIYAGKLNGSRVNNVTVEDPLQFSCQKNYTILSTDGFWNGAAGTKLDGSTSIGNVDGLLPRPYNDGASQTAQQRTAKLRKRTVTQSAQKGVLQTRTIRIQQQESFLQTRTSTNSGRNWTDWTNTNYCATDTSGSTRAECRYSNWSAWESVSSCSAQGRDTRNPYNVDVARNCQTAVVTGWTTVTSCTPSHNASTGVTVECGYSWSTSAPTATCSPAYDGDNYPAVAYRNCSTTAGNWSTVTSCQATNPGANGQYTECGYENWSGWSNIGSCTPRAPSTGPNYTVDVARECNATTSGGTSNTLADVAAYYYYTDLRDPASTTGENGTGTCVGPVIPPATTPSDLCTNNVIAYGRDTNPAQHMTTHTLGLGVQGQMVYSQYQNNLVGQRVYSPDYWTQPSGDFYAVANGSIASPSTGICSWMNSGSSCTWSIPSDDSTANIDDLWHAAVNGHGTYFSATDPQSLADALTNVLGQITLTPRPGTAAAAASSNPNVTPADNYVFSSSYRSIEWYGELIMQQLDASGTPGEQQWSAMQLLDCATTPWQAGRALKAGDAFKYDGACYVVNTEYTTGAAFGGDDTQNTTQLAGTPINRTIYTAQGSSLVPFTWDGLSAAQRAFFTMPHINYVSAAQGLSQFCVTGATCLNDAAKASASGQALVDFLRGDRSNEGTYFRQRARVLGDIVSSEAEYVKQPPFRYSDAGYADFKAAKANRAATVYVGANDGMLHAFDAITGQERWAFIPPSLLPDLHLLADIDYNNKHRYFVDGTAETGDICPSAPSSTCSASEWRTILVGGMNQGGQSYYALDVTDPASPTFLWEFSAPELGYSYGNPRIGKLENGRWVVFVSSGYNNADGIGRVFVLNAKTGALIDTISTGAGSASNPAGLARISAHAPTAETNNTVARIYGGDLLGNLWRFDVNGNIGAAGKDAHKLIEFKTPTGVAQPITARPLVATIDTHPVVFVGTGQYLGVSDLATKTVNSFYAVKDKQDSTTLTTPRANGSEFVKQSYELGPCPAGAPTSICDPGQIVRLGTGHSVDWSVRNGWYIDFISAGERSATDPQLALGTLTFTTIRPQSLTAATLMGCDDEEQGVDAKSDVYYLDYRTGGAISGTHGVIGEELCTCVATRPAVVRTQGGKIQALIRTSGGGVGGVGTDMGQTNLQDLPYAGGSSPSRRISWRELNGD